MKKLSGKTREAGTIGRIVPMLAFALCSLLSLLPGSFAAFDDLGAGARGPGMGNAMTPVADDVSAVHYNAAGLGLLTRPQFTAAYTQLYMGLTDDSKLGTSFFGCAYPLKEGKQGTIAGALNTFSLDGSLYRENTAYLSYGRLAFARPGRGELFLGASLKYLYSSFGSFAEAGNATDGILMTGQADPLLTGNPRSKAFDADLGALYRFMKHYQLGLQVAHAPRPDVAFSSGDSDRLPLTTKLGFNYKSLISNLVAQYEMKKAPDGSQDRIFTAAAERWFPTAFIGDLGARAGMGMGTRDYQQLSMGLSYRSRRVQIDYGYAIPLHTITDSGGSHRMAITFHFGKVTEEEETLEMLLQAMRALKKPAPAEVVRTTVTVFAAPEPTEAERALAEKLARAEEAIRGKRYREAVKLCNSALELDPASTAAWQDLGIALLGQGKLESSLKAWEKAYEFEKSPALRAAIKGYLKSISRQIDLASKASARRRAAAPQAAPAGAQAPALSQAEIDALLDQGVDQYVSREFEKARGTFEKVLAADPDNIEALKALRRVEAELK